MPIALRRRRPSGEKRTAHGVNVVGFLSAESGLGTAVRNHVAALHAAGIPCTVRDFAQTLSRRQDRSIAWAQSHAQPYDTNLVHVNADKLILLQRECGPQFFRDRHNILYWTWELPTMPRQWPRLVERTFQEVWTPSAYTQHILQQHLQIPVHRVPHPVVLRHRDGLQLRSAYGIPDDAYCFALCFDYLSAFERKNPLAVTAAFRQAFPEDEPVHLLIKCSNAEHAPLEHAQLTFAAADTRMTLVDRYLSTPDTHALLSLSDAYISLHRCEGFGLTIAEAMALGKPVIATGYSGNTDFMTEANSYLVRYELTELEADTDMYKRGDTWADPDIAHAAECMRHIYDNRAEAHQKGAHAQADIECLSLECIGREMAKRLAPLSG